MLILDCECFPNYFCVWFKHIESGEFLKLDLSKHDIEVTAELSKLLNSSLLITFNGNSYDLPLLQLALRGYNASELHEASGEIIGGARTSDFRKKYNLEYPEWNHIDLIEVCPLEGSLKLYAARLHCPKLQECPHDPSQPVTAAQIEEVDSYCRNDLDCTELIWRELCPQIELRKTMGARFGIDLRSKSDAQIAEQIIGHGIHKRAGKWPKRRKVEVGAEYRYNAPAWMNFADLNLQVILDLICRTKFVVGETGHVQLPAEIEGRTVTVGNHRYRLGIGGLHSLEKREWHVADEETFLSDNDVSGYYPRIILTQKLYPANMGPRFLEVYQEIFDIKESAKRAGNLPTAAGFKIAANGSFGKFGDKWSILYSPQMVIQVTLSGQLMLLMLIELLEQEGLPVVSANTDGVVIKCPHNRAQTLRDAIKAWELVTDMITEETRYKALYSRDVNSYLALKENGKWKTKGAYGDGGGPLWKNPQARICSTAAQAYLRDGKPLEETIRKCRDIREFVCIRRVNGGAQHNGQPVGKVVRWYYSKTAGDCLRYAASARKVAGTDGCQPLMILPTDVPVDLDYDRYIREADNILEDVGVKGQMSLFC